MGNIYNVTNWEKGQSYKVNAIVKNGSFYYYARAYHFSGDTFISYLWDGTGLWNNETKPLFFWKPSYASDAPITPKVREVAFGDGYTQRNPDGINNVLLKLNLNFDLRTNAEATAILHFLHTRGGWESFIFTPPDPYSTKKLFICKDWATSFNFLDNYTIKAVFEESVV